LGSSVSVGDSVKNIELSVGVIVNEELSVGEIVNEELSVGVIVDEELSVGVIVIEELSVGKVVISSDGSTVSSGFVGSSVSIGMSVGDEEEVSVGKTVNEDSSDGSTVGSGLVGSKVSASGVTVMSVGDNSVSRVVGSIVPYGKKISTMAQYVSRVTHAD